VIVYCATTNPGKIAEFRLASLDSISIEPMPGMRDIEPCDEKDSTFEENAIEKALYYGSRLKGWLFAEDSGLEVDALGGAPGVYSARFAGPAASDNANNLRLLELLDEKTDRKARYVCVIALVHDGKLIHTYRGEVEGEILFEPRGAKGFGYDPLFYYPPFGCSFGEVSPALKQTVSHRGRALNHFIDSLKLKTI
jgi:XTP/dITP diphosphohydrolase